MAAAGHLVYKNARVLKRHIMGGAFMMLTAENGAYRIIRLEVIRFLVNFHIAPAPSGHLGFRKMYFWSTAVSGQ